MKVLKIIDSNSCLKNNCLEFPGIGIEKIFEEVRNSFPNSKNIFISSDFYKKRKT